MSAIGQPSDPAVAAGASGSVTAKLRRLTQQIDDLSAGSTSSLRVQDAGPAWTTLRTYTSSANATGGIDLTTAPTSGEKIVLVDVLVSTDVTMRLDYQEETTGTVLFSQYVAGYTPAQYTPRGKLKLDTADKKLRLVASIAGNVRVTCLYYSEA